MSFITKLLIEGRSCFRWVTGPKWSDIKPGHYWAMWKFDLSHVFSYDNFLLWQ